MRSFSVPVDLTDINDARSASTPALTASRERLFLAWRGQKERTLYWSTFDGSSWSKAHCATEQLGAQSDGSPAVMYDPVRERLHMAWLAAGTQDIWSSSHTGSRWSRPHQITSIVGAKAAGAPAGTVDPVTGKLFICWRDSEDGRLWMSVCDGYQWSGPLSITRHNGARSPARPAIAYDPTLRRLALVWRLPGDGRLAYSYYDGEWTPPEGVAPEARARAVSDPTVVAGHGHLVVLFLCRDSSRKLKMTEFDGARWSRPTEVLTACDSQATAAPATAWGRISLHVAYRGERGGRLWYLRSRL